MTISIPGLIGAVLMSGIGMVQLEFMKRVLAKSRLELAAAEKAEREKMHGKILKMAFVIDLLVLPAAGYYFGQTVFGK